MKRAWQEGYDASKAGKSPDVCPYDFSDGDFSDWLTGYGAYDREDMRSDLSLDDADYDDTDDGDVE